MKKIVSKVLYGALAAFLALGCAACGNSDPRREGRVNIEFWGWADAMEYEVFSAMVETFNSRQDEIYVNYTKKPGGDYQRALVQALGGRGAPDIFYVPEDELKSYVSQDYIYDISELVKESKIVNLDDMWDSLKQRYSFDQNTFQYSENAPIWGLSKDLGVSAIYYNADAFQKAGITVISVPESEVGAESEKHGFYQKDGKAYFNNRIAMTWEELVEVSKLLTRGYNENSPTLYGYYDERPLGYLWSVGGDTVRYVESGDPAYNGGYWEWTLGDTEAHTLNGKTLPSNREAINFWTSLSTGNNEKYGLTKPVSPYPSIVSDQYSAFTDQQAAMLVLPRYAVSAFRRDCDFNWDVAPVVKHADGVQAGYTTSMCYSLSVNSNKQKYAFKFMEYMSGPEGQAELAKHGFNVPNQISVTNSDAFLKSTEPPFNNAVFAEGAVYQRVGDWTYLPDTAWSDAYEDAMNDVRNGRKTIDSLISDFESTVNTYLKRYTAKK